jgi:hypothetical protein
MRALMFKSGAPRCTATSRALTVLCPHRQKIAGAPTNLTRRCNSQEIEANTRRWEESGHKGSVDDWKWTLNWNEVLPNVVIGSCPRSAQNLVRLFCHKHNIVISLLFLCFRRVHASQVHGRQVSLRGYLSEPVLPSDHERSVLPLEQSSPSEPIIARCECHQIYKRQIDFCLEAFSCLAPSERRSCESSSGLVNLAHAWQSFPASYLTFPSKPCCVCSAHLPERPRWTPCCVFRCANAKP